MNENGERLADICGLNELVIWGTIFEHKAIRKLKCDGFPQMECPEPNRPCLDQLRSL